jgi:hypothetical protein
MGLRLRLSPDALRRVWQQRGRKVERRGDGPASTPEEYAQLRDAMTRHLHEVADFVDLERHDRALESFRSAMAISSELEIRAARAPTRWVGRRDAA